MGGRTRGVVRRYERGKRGITRGCKLRDGVLKVGECEREGRDIAPPLPS